MISKIRYIVLIFQLALMYACASDFDEVYFGSAQIVVDGVLIPGEQPVIRLSELNDLNDTTQIPVFDAIVSIYFHDQRYDLDLTNESLGEYTFNGSGLEVLAGEIYILEIEYYDNFLYAETNIPYPPENVELELVTDEYVDSLGVAITYNYIDVWWGNQPESFYYAYLNCDSLNPLAENYCDLFFNSDYPFWGNYYSFDATGLIPENIYDITIYSMTEDYVQYYYPYGSVGSESGYLGNIENGYGIFTGICATNITFQYFTDSVSVVKK